ncbi:hypothetical protein BaRGS_00009556 [Batillaria attramentaria]|uniref:Uncharacterized protein n=1 Tax=Batillaria attramentaria TaxID=370345 RepID=A0ABD0LJ37_9CAEN
MTVGWRTLDIGEQALVYNHVGQARIEEGPKRIFLWRETYRELERVSANQNEYLVISYKDGRTEHRKGPCVEFINPVVHTNICKQEMISLDANEALIIYTASGKGPQATHRVEYGPTLYMLKANEWLHTFAWHGTDPSNKTRMIPRNDVFTKLRIIPDQFYYNVDEVRTADDALVRVKLMMFYELVDLQRMLDSTSDPMADFVNCLCADVVAYASGKTYLEFIEQAGELNDLQHFPRLLERSHDIGYKVSKVVFRGYHAHDKLQRMHDTAIAKRTDLKLTFEKEEREQALIDSQLHSEMNRMEQEQKMEMAALEHKQRLEREQVTHQLTMEKQKHQQSQLKEQQEHEAHLRAKKWADKQRLSHLTSLHSLGVKVTDVLLAESHRPAEVVQVLSDGKGANMHLHYS